MPIYEYYCDRNHTVYQFFARSLAQGKLSPRCPDNPAWPLKRVVSQFAFTGLAREPQAPADTPAEVGGADEARLESAMAEMERDFSSVDESDPRAMAHMMRRMSELTGEKIDGEMEEVVRKLEEGVDPDKLEEQLGSGVGGDGADDMDGDPYGMGGGSDGSGVTAPAEADKKEARMRYKLRRAATAPRRDPKLYDYD